MNGIQRAGAMDPGDPLRAQRSPKNSMQADEKEPRRRHARC
jgi:hypothetical protein